MSKGGPRSIYFIGGAELVKIGVSADPARRLRSLETGSPVKLTMLAQEEVHSGMAYALEKGLHEMARRDRSHGEWFRRSTFLEGCIELAAQGRLVKLWAGADGGHGGSIHRKDRERIRIHGRRALQRAAAWRMEEIEEAVRLTSRVVRRLQNPEAADEMDRLLRAFMAPLQGGVRDPKLV